MALIQAFCRGGVTRKTIIKRTLGLDEMYQKVAILYSLVVTCR